MHCDPFLCLQNSCWIQLALFNRSIRPFDFALCVAQQRIECAITKNVDLRGLKTINHKGDGSRAP